MATSGTLGWCNASLVPRSRKCLSGCRTFSTVGRGQRREVIVHIDRNHLGGKKVEVLQNEYRELGKRLKIRI